MIVTLLPEHFWALQYTYLNADLAVLFCYIESLICFAFDINYYYNKYIISFYLWAELNLDSESLDWAELYHLHCIMQDHK
jgi:hypothetical protein